MFCTNCGKELPDSAKFCSGCGTPVAPPDVPQAPQPSSDPIRFPGAGFPGDEPVIPEPPVSDASAPAEEAPSAEEPAPAEETPAAEPAPVSVPAAIPASASPAVDSGAVQPAVKRRGKAGLVVLGAGAAAVILVALLLAKLLSGLGSGSGKAVYAYLNDDGELMYLADLKEKTQALELTDEAGGSPDVQFSPDGKTVYFTDSDSTLYSIAVSELKKGGKPERISRDVSSFRLLKDGRLTYIKRSSNNYELNVLEKGESYRLLKNWSNIRYSEDQKTVYYTERNEADDTLTLYKITIAKDAKEERLLKGADTIYTSYDSSVLVYGVSDSGSGDSNNNLTVYSCTPGGDKTKLIDDIYSISGVKVDGSKVSFYYYVEEVEDSILYDFVTDSKASSDASILSGEQPVNPSWYDYFYNYGIDRDLGVGYYTDRQGNWYDFDISSLLTDGKTVNNLYYWDVRSLAEEEAHKRYDPVKADYDARIDAWNEAWSREYLRENLRDFDYTQRYLDLYQYTGSDKSEPIGTEISSIGRTGSAANGIFLYHKANVAGGKVADVSELDYAYQVVEMLESGEGDDQWYQNVGGKESVIDLDDVTSVNSVYVLNGKEVVLNVYDGDDYILQAYSLGNNALTFSSTIVDGDDFSVAGQATVSGTDVLYIFTDVDYDNYSTVGDFAVYKNGKLESIAKEIYGAAILDESGATYAVTDFDSRGNAEVALMKDGKATTITDELTGDFAFLDSTQLLYISDGDLMLWNGKESRQIARDVEEFWASVQESYSTYSPDY